jgi:hypothetical protein
MEQARQVHVLFSSGCRERTGRTNKKQKQVEVENNIIMVE